MGREVDSPRTIPGGAAVPDGTVAQIFRKTDLVTPVASVAVSAGKYDHSYDGSYGPVETRVTFGGETRIRDSHAIGQAGPIQMGDLVYWMQALGPAGVIPAVGNKLQVIAGGVGRTVRIRDGCGAAAGIIYNQATDNKASPTFATNVSGNPRIDLIGFQVWTAGHAEEGRAELAILQGTPAATPVAPTPGQDPTAGTWFEPLAEVTLANGFATITAGNIKDVRRYLGQQGRVLLRTVPFTALTEVIADSIFTAEHRNYEIDLNVDDSSAGGSLRFRFRAAGVAATAATHDWSFSGRSDNDTLVSGGGNGDTFIQLVGSMMSGAVDLGGTIALFDPQRTRKGRLTTVLTYADATNSMDAIQGGGMLHNTTAYDGFVLYPNLGTISGEIRVYGKGV